MAWEARTVAEKPNLLIGFLALFGCLFCIALRAGWYLTFHQFFRALAALLNVRIGIGIGPSVRPFAFLANEIASLDNDMTHWIGRGIDATGHAFIESLLWVAYQLTMIGVALAAVTYEVLLGLKLLHRKTTPEYIQAQAKPLVAARTAPLARTKVVADSRVPALARELAATNARLAALESSIALPAPVSVPRELPRVGTLEKDWQWARSKINRLTQFGTVAGIIGLIGATIFDQFGLGWLRCRGVGRAGRTLCGLSSVLEGLAADALDVILVTHLCQIVTLMSKGAEFAEPAIARLVSMTDHLIKCQGATKPTDWQAAWYEPPPSENLVAL